MFEVLSAVAVAVLLCAGAVLGFFVRKKLPERHTSRETLELVQLVLGMMVTFAAIVLGLVTASVRTGYENAYHDRSAYAARLAELDQCLRNYGPATAMARGQLHGYTAAVIASTWPGEPLPTGVPYPNTAGMALIGEDATLADIINGVGLDISRLSPADAWHQKLAADCAADFNDTLRQRWAVIEDAHASISGPFFGILVVWLVIVFAGFGLCAPRNSLVLVVITLCAISFASVTFVVRDMDTPYGGLFGISSQSMRAALRDMLR